MPVKAQTSACPRFEPLWRQPECGTQYTLSGFGGGRDKGKIPLGGCVPRDRVARASRTGAWGLACFWRLFLRCLRPGSDMFFRMMTRRVIFGPKMAQKWPKNPGTCNYINPYHSILDPRKTCKNVHFSALKNTRISPGPFSPDYFTFIFGELGGIFLERAKKGLHGAIFPPFFGY